MEAETWHILRPQKEVGGGAPDGKYVAGEVGHEWVPIPLVIYGRRVLQKINRSLQVTIFPCVKQARHAYAVKWV